MAIPPFTRRPAARFVAVYLYQSPTGAPTRSQLSSTTANLAHPQARSETAVVAYLRKRHPGHEITLLSLDFQDATGASV